MRREGRRGPPPGRRIRARDGVGEAAGVEMSRSMGGGGEKIEETSEVGREDDVRQLGEDDGQEYRMGVAARQQRGR
jgi:hypothetical protein